MVTRRKTKATPAPETTEERRLLQAVYEDPSDDAPRSVYADFLQQRGDPHGELIALQLQPSLARPQRNRVAEILRDKAAIARRLGPIASVVRDPAFERGFLHACRLDPSIDAMHRDILLHPAWSTVCELGTRGLEPIDSPAMRSLRAVSGLELDGLAQLARRMKPVGLEAISVSHAFDMRRDDQPSWRDVCEVGALEKLARLELVVPYKSSSIRSSEPEGYDWLLDSALGRQLESFELDHPDAAPTSAHAWLRAMRERPTLRRIVLRHHGGRGDRWRSLPIIITRDGKRFAITVVIGHVSVAGKLGAEVHGLPDWLEGFPDRSAPALIVRVEAPKAYFELVRKHLEKPLGRRFERVSFEND